uniref:Uncharacterized protein n=1 Tax=candidate division WOR-3 bacterium TaxID=2052148 RepID=A0A7C4U7Z8_UNCW3
MVIIFLFSDIFQDVKIGFGVKTGGFYDIKNFLTQEAKSKMGSKLELIGISWIKDTGIEGTYGFATQPSIGYMEIIFKNHLTKKGENRLNLGYGLGFYSTSGGSVGGIVSLEYQMLSSYFVNLLSDIKSICVYGTNDGIIRLGFEFSIGFVFVL